MVKNILDNRNKKQKINENETLLLRGVMQGRKEITPKMLYQLH